MRAKLLGEEALQLWEPQEPSPLPLSRTGDIPCVGQQVMARFLAQRTSSPGRAFGWHSGCVVAVSPRGSASIEYNDGDKEKHVPLRYLRGQSREESRKQRHEVEEREALSENVSESLLTRVVEELIDASCAEWDKEQLCKQHWGELLTGGRSVS